jgi:hypothetical protein
VINIKVCTVTDAEAMNWIILDVDVVNRAISKHFCELNEVVGSVSLVSNVNCTHVSSSDSLGDPSITSYTIPPSLSVTIKNGAFGGCNFDVGAANLDKRIVGVKVLPKCCAFERDLASSLQL